MKRVLVLIALQSALIQLFAQIPNGYYSSADGSCGASLKTELNRIINPHTVISYDGLWNAFKTTDKREDGKVWDMYSSSTNYVFGEKQGTSYKKEGDSYNREHSFPKSWFNDARPMYSDLYHLYPTDGYVNNRRSNYPFGETNNPTYTSHGGFCKLGPSSTPGYSGVVFEPADEYKGDFARTYFYMATCYEKEIANWNSPMLAHNSYPAYAKWALDMLLRWAQNDPVSPKEINRNNEVYKLQKNRNPFIDFPGLEEYIWGNKMDVIFDSDNYNSNQNEVTIQAPVFSPASGQIAKGSSITISSKTANATIVYSINDGTQQEGASPVVLTVDSDMKISAFAKLNDKSSSVVSAEYTIITNPDQPIIPSGKQYFSAVTSTNDLTVGAQYIIVCEETQKALSEQGSDIRSQVDVSINNNVIYTEVNGTNLPYTLTLGGSENQYTFYDATSKCYLALNIAANKLHTNTEATSNNTHWQISIDATNTSIINCAYNDRSIQYNAKAPRFACYKSPQKSVRLYKMQQSTSIQNDTYLNADYVDVYSISGRCIKKQVMADKALQGLPAGIYIINGKKVLK